MYGDAAAYAGSMATAAGNRAFARNQAVAAFEAAVAPAVTQQASGDADAELTEATSEADAVLDDTTIGDKAVHDYAYAEAADYEVKQAGDAQALASCQIAEATGHAAAIVSFAAANASPWADAAAAQAVAQSQEEIGDALAQLSNSIAGAVAQEVNRSQKVQDAIRGSQRILKDANINLWDNVDDFADFAKKNPKQTAGAENFAWALSREGYGLHSDDYALEVYKRLQAAKSGGAPAIKKELANMRDILEKGDSFWSKQ